MHDLLLNGVVVDFRTQAIGAMKHVPESCTLSYLESSSGIDDDETQAYTGPLLAAPPGTYLFGWSLISASLIISATKFLLGATLLHERTPQRDATQFLEPVVHQSFKDLLVNSERLVAVYQGHDATDRNYRFVWPSDVHALPPMSDPHHTLYGLVKDVTTGEILRV